MVEYNDRSQENIYEDVKKRFDQIKWNGNRDDEDAYDAAIGTINSYISQDFEILNQINLNGIDINDDTSRFVFDSYIRLLNQLQQEYDDLERNGTDHYLWTSCEPHIQRLAGRINEAEYDTLINRRVHDAKYELINRNIMITAIPCDNDPLHSLATTPPIFTKSANGKTISEVLEYSKRQNPNISDDLTYTIDYTNSTNPELRKYGVVYVDGYGKFIESELGGDSPTLSYSQLPAREGVTIASSKYLEARKDYIDNDKSSFKKYDTPGGIDVVAEDNYYKLCEFGDPENFKTFEDMLKNLENFGEYNEYRECIVLLNNNPTLKAVFKKLFDDNIDKRALYEFLAKSETKLDHVVQKNKKMGFRLSEVPIQSTEPGLAQVNFVGDVDISNEDTKGSGIREVLFRDGDTGVQGQRCSINSPYLYESLHEEKKALELYLTERIRQKRGDGKYAKLELKEEKIKDSEFRKIDKKNIKEKENYELMVYGIEQILVLCDNFSSKFGMDGKFQPSQLVKVQEHLDDVLRDLEKGYRNGRLPTREKWAEICKEVQANWIEFKNNDTFFASITDRYACNLISQIFYAGDRDIIQTSVKELGNGMTLFDNTTGSSAVQDAISDEGDDLLIQDKTFNECRKKINTDFTIKLNEDGEIISDTSKMDALFDTYQENWSNVDVFMYLESNGYLPPKTKLWEYNGKIESACENILQGLKSKKELLKNQSWRLTPEKVKVKLLEEKDELSRRDNLTDEQIAYLNGINVMIENDSYLEDVAMKQNDSAEKSIRYGDMQELIVGGFTDYLIDEGQGVMTKDGKKSKKIEMINDSYGIGRLNLSDANCEAAPEVLSSILQEVAICAIAAAIGSVTAGVGGAAILALRASALAARGAKLFCNIRRMRRIANLCKFLGTATKYVAKLGKKIKSSIRLIGAGGDEALAVAKESKAVVSTAKKRKEGAKLIDMYKSGKEAIKGMKVAGFILEGTGFHVANTAIHNAINGSPIGEGLNPFGSTEFVDPETGEVIKTSNFRGYIESIAFISTLKIVGAPIQGLTSIGLSKLLGETAFTKSAFAKFFQGGASISGELLSLQVTEQALNLAFDQKLKNITVEDFIHSLGMVIGLRITGLFGKAIKYTVKEYNKAKGEAKVDVDGKTVTINNNGEMHFEGEGMRNEEGNIEGEDYFGGKSNKTGVTETQARENSRMMDELSELGEGGKEKLKKEIERQWKERQKEWKEIEGQELELTDEQLESIIKAHEEEGTLGELTTEQLAKKNRILAETIHDENVRRFLLESGFCGKLWDKIFSNKGGDQGGIGESNNIDIEVVGYGGYHKDDVVTVRSLWGHNVSAKITKYDPKTGLFQVMYRNTDKYITDYVSKEDLDRLNSQNEFNEYGNLDYKPGAVVSIPGATEGGILAGFDKTSGYATSYFQDGKRYRMRIPATDIERFNPRNKSDEYNNSDYKSGTVVSIQRSDGSITKGAIIVDINYGTQLYTVRFIEDGVYKEKPVSKGDLDKLNGDYSFGTTVSVQRSDGSITKGAVIVDINYDPHTHNILSCTVGFVEGGQYKEKTVSKNDLDRLNGQNKGNKNGNVGNSPRTTDITQSEKVRYGVPSREYETPRGTNGIQSRMEMREVPRSTDVIAIGDLHGEYEALKGNLLFAGLATVVKGQLKWTGGNKKVVFQGDILADRGTDGLKIITEIHKLREEAKKQGGDIEILVGNHDDFMITYLLGLKGDRYGGNGDPLSISMIGNAQGVGITELAKFLSTWTSKKEPGVDSFNYLLKEGNQKILNNMRKSKEGKIILEEICNMKIVSIIDDVLYCHTNPTVEMLNILTDGNVRQNVDLLNKKYQSYLRYKLLGEGTGGITDQEFSEIADIFLATSNRDNAMWGIEDWCKMLKNSGINMISHGHNGGRGYVDHQKVINGVLIVDSDYGYGSRGNLRGPHSVSVVRTNGNVFKGENAGSHPIL